MTSATLVKHKDPATVVVQETWFSMTVQVLEGNLNEIFRLLEINCKEKEYVYEKSETYFSIRKKDPRNLEQLITFLNANEITVLNPPKDNEI